MRLPIADCRLPIGGLFPRSGLARRRHDCSQFISLLQKRAQFASGHNSRLDEQLDPQRGFIGLLHNSPDFGDKLGLASRPATSPVVGRNRGSASQNLFGENASGIVILWNRTGHLDDSQCKRLGPSFQFGGSHEPPLQTQSSTGNPSLIRNERPDNLPQSAICNRQSAMPL